MPNLYSEKSAFSSNGTGDILFQNISFSAFFFLFRGGGLPLLEYTFASFCDRLEASNRTFLCKVIKKS